MGACAVPRGQLPSKGGVLWAIHVSLRPDAKRKFVSRLQDSKGDYKGIWTFPNSFSGLCLIIIWHAAARVIGQLPPFAFLAWGKTATAM